MSDPRWVEKPWGHEVWWAQTDSYAGKLLYVEAGHRLSLQFHGEKDESSYLLSGRLRLTRGASARRAGDRGRGSWVLLADRARRCAYDRSDRGRSRIGGLDRAS